MWLIEFVDGHLDGTILPVSSSLRVCGEESGEDKDTYYIPELLNETDSFTLDIKNSGVILSSSLKKKSDKRLIDNAIYTYFGISFFVYKKGQRDPKTLAYKLYKSKYYLLSVLSMNLFATVTVFMGLQQYHVGQFAETIKQLDGSYIQSGKIILKESDQGKKLPEIWKKNSKWVDVSVDHYWLSTLAVQVVSIDTGQKLKSKIVKKKGFNQIRVNGFEKDLRIMAALGEAGLAFKRVDDSWQVDSKPKASKALREAGLRDVISKLVVVKGQSDIIPASDFPYSIYFSTTSVSYIYDDKARYWVGSTVPDLGVLKKITSTEIVFVDGKDVRKYLIGQ